MRLNSSLFLLTAFALSVIAQPPAVNRPLSTHFSDPVIIENPDTFINLLPLNHAGSLIEHPDGQGRDWSVRDHSPLVKIKLTITGSAPGPAPSLNSGPVIVEFDRRVSASSRPKVGMLLISWRPESGSHGNLVFHSFADNPGGSDKLHWKPSPNSRQLQSRNGEPYRVRLVRFHDAQGNAKCLPANCLPVTGEPTVRLALCTAGKLADCN